MRIPFFLFIFIMSSLVQAEVFSGKIHSIKKGTNGQAHLIFMENGEVVFVHPDDKSALTPFEDHLKKGETLEIERNEKNHLVSSKIVPAIVNTDELMSLEKNTPPVVSSQKLGIQSVFMQMRNDYRDKSQCYNRAHVWTYEAWKSGVNMSKLFLFFTDRYIRNYNFGWWFHVTPTLNGLTMDRRYTRGPLNYRTWSNTFVYSHRGCPMINYYSQYNNNQESQDCYLLPTTKYFWQPRDAETYENTGYRKTSYDSSEISWAYSDGFGL
jgi:hypothetical protein